MMFKVDGARRAAFSGVVLAAALGLASCGGGGEQVQDFAPTRVLSFGDENSVINTNGSKYTVNALVADTASLDCASNPIWIQAVASHYGLQFPQCNPANVATPDSQIYATAGAMVEALAGQIDQQINNGGFGSRDLVTILIGQNDILTQYRRLAAGAPQADVDATLTEAATTLAAQVNRVADLGGKVLISTVPDLGLTPFAISEERFNVGRAATLSALTLEFNSVMRAAIANDGRKIGLVLTDERVQLLVKATTNLGFVNVTDAACSVALPRCTTDTLVVDPNSTTVPATFASGETWLWADATHLSAGGHKSIGTLATQRATNNPF